MIFFSIPFSEPVTEANFQFFSIEAKFSTSVSVESFPETEISTNQYQFNPEKIKSTKIFRSIFIFNINAKPNSHQKRPWMCGKSFHTNTRYNETHQIESSRFTEISVRFLRQEKFMRCVWGIVSAFTNVWRSVNLTTAHMLTLKRNLIGSGSFGHVYKAVKRIEGIFYAVKISKEKISKRTSHKMVQLNKEICALSVLGKSHQNLIRYYSSWIEEDRGKFWIWGRNPRTRMALSTARPNTILSLMDFGRCVLALLPFAKNDHMLSVP